MGNCSVLFEHILQEQDAHFGALTYGTRPTGDIYLFARTVDFFLDLLFGLLFPHD